MSQIFHRSTNTLSRATIFGAVRMPRMDPAVTVLNEQPAQIEQPTGLEVKAAA